MYYSDDEISITERCPSCTILTDYAVKKFFRCVFHVHATLLSKWSGFAYVWKNHCIMHARPVGGDVTLQSNQWSFKPSLLVLIITTLLIWYSAGHVDRAFHYIFWLFWTGCKMGTFAGTFQVRDNTKIRDPGKWWHLVTILYDGWTVFWDKASFIHRSLLMSTTDNSKHHTGL